ncbi:MarR family transcriptional regulator [Clostridium sp. OS1-26]|uniref:MarR family winged helix-turn-helix transcriptional regulator n=1 Tax=Clostridium sp. OS1-26 TaxID=3070681 RepID=UPI0027DFDDDC|nr:MarR family transcriptional regulator [Clostridium sp. OS1-26]WML35589.1 MarR family transcriptional regulator [Clostridium sp. OS1-26]
MKENSTCEVDKLIGYWLKRIYRNMINLHNHKLEKYGFTVSQVSVLAQLWREDGLTQKEIAERLQIKPPSLTGLVDTLVSRGWVLRKEDEKDARIKRLYVTAEGRELSFKSLEVAKEMEDILCKGFTVEEKQLLFCWIKKIYANLD